MSERRIPQRTDTRQAHAGAIRAALAGLGVYPTPAGQEAAREDLGYILKTLGELAAGLAPADAAALMILASMLQEADHG